MRFIKSLSLVSAAVTASGLLFGCLGQANESVDDDAIQFRPGHGTAAMPAPEADNAEVAQAEQALSTSTGTTFDLTYYVISLRPVGDPNEVTIRDCAGNFLTYASRKWRDDAIMQGTARYKTSSGESRTINAGSGCWVRITDYDQRWGLGVWNTAANEPFALRPFRSIAVDRNVLTVGKWYYIKELDGVQMPYPASTMVHDGCVRAVDVGPAIIGRHIDFFSGYYSAYESLIQGSSTMGGKEQISLYSGTYKCALHIERGY
jgi:3D (Asp-Asp-Asp) domain-containing protein